MALVCKYGHNTGGAIGAPVALRLFHFVSFRKTTQSSAEGPCSRFVSRNKQTKKQALFFLWLRPRPERRSTSKFPRLPARARARHAWRLGIACGGALAIYIHIYIYILRRVFEHAVALHTLLPREMSGVTLAVSICAFYSPYTGRVFHSGDLIDEIFLRDSCFGLNSARKIFMLKFIFW
jgi:hypothetical protein